MLSRLAYLGVTNAFAMLRLLPMSDRDKNIEILALRHQITVLHRRRQHEDQKDQETNVRPRTNFPLLRKRILLVIQTDPASRPLLDHAIRDRAETSTLPQGALLCDHELRKGGDATGRAA
ncbi:hypothetical protein [Saccharopolyspora phatthalungensis]|uniref:Uncharacterized protein n=1 Tax=Saccharopolyspora phatthalungensis TaxID=664693 RepID=A0A840Q9G1_9PSEU|nr:hypothetical protein [Saccharopolyspora phatthalungensis]MBB5157404.1 hypothetical protein [Saccharopolyspora phatthalungensis]